MVVRGRSFLAAKHRPRLLLLSLLLAASSIPHRAAIIVVGAFSSPARHSSSFRSTGLDDNNNAPTHRHHPPSSPSSGTTTSSIRIGIPNARQSSCSRCHVPSTALRSAAGTSEISKEEQIAATVAAAVAAASDNDDAPGRRRRRHYDAVIVGGGPAGLLSAIMMAQQLSKPSTSTSSSNTSSPRIVVYDRLPPPPSPDDLVYAADVSKYYLLGLGHRGQAALKHFNAWDDVERASVAVVGRRGWSPGKTKEEDGVITLAKKTVTSRVLPRDKLVGVLKRVLEERYGDAVELRYGWQVDPISFGNEEDDGTGILEGGESDDDDGNGPPVKLQISRCIPAAGASEEGAEECSIEGDDDANPSTITTSFLIGTDGAARTIANAMEANDAKRKRPNPLKQLFGSTAETTPFAVKRYEDDNPRVYKSVPIEFPSRWPRNLNYSARSSGNRVTFEALPSDAEGTYCALLLMTPDDPLASANCDPKALREFFDEEFPQFSKLLDDGAMGDVAGKGASSLPSFRYAGPRLHEGRRTVILGDCVHTVKPYFGLGANTALEDVQILSKILSKDDNNTPAALENLHDKLRQFTKQRAADSKALVTISRNMDRPGKLGTFRFVFPLILDSTFHKFLPKLFAPGMFGMFQMEGVGFGRIRNRKRLDRVMQSAVIMGVLYGLGAGARLLVKSVARMLDVGNYVVGGSLVALFGAVGAVRKLAKAEGK